jgi:polysaccharide biosynthesis/export protein
MLARRINIGLNLISVVVLLLTISCLNGCAPSAQSGVTADSNASQVQAGSNSPAVNEPGNSPSHPADQASAQRLEAIWQARAQQRVSTKFPLGPGDVLEVSVPEMEELRNRQVRVSEDDTIELPLIGTINVGGMDEDGVGTELRNRLKEYMRDPQVDVFVQHYQSRDVAVAGMVQKPGLYAITGRSDTILSMIGRAGGLSEKASTQMIFIPAPSSSDKSFSSQGSPAVPILTAEADNGPSSETNHSAKADAGGQPGAVNAVSAEAPVAEVTDSPTQSAQTSQVSSTLPGGASDPISIDFSSLKSNNRLDVPVLPGDVIIVPAAGEVMVRGWVKTPGAFAISPGMTALGAITAAGGEMFSSSAVLLRTGNNGQQIELPFNVSDVQRGVQPDPTVQSGDVIVVNSSAIGAVPYLVYSIFSKFGTGAYFAPF